MLSGGLHKERAVLGLQPARKWESNSYSCKKLIANHLFRTYSWWDAHIYVTHSKLILPWGCIPSPMIPYKVPLYVIVTLLTELIVLYIILPLFNLLV